MINQRTAERADTVLLSLEEAARLLGYTVKGLRMIVDRSRAKAKGARTRGATIRFFQVAKGSPIKFKREWIEEFIAAHTVDPGEGVASFAANSRIERRSSELLDL